jgi:hypothetical protein
MEMPQGSDMMMSPRALMRMVELSASPAGRRQRGDAIPARFTTWRKIPIWISWGNVVCAARDGHRITWSC